MARGVSGGVLVRVRRLLAGNAFSRQQTDDSKKATVFPIGLSFRQATTELLGEQHEGGLPTSQGDKPSCDEVVLGNRAECLSDLRASLKFR